MVQNAEHDGEINGKSHTKSLRIPLQSNIAAYVKSSNRAELKRENERAK